MLLKILYKNQKVDNQQIKNKNQLPNGFQIQNNQ